MTDQSWKSKQKNSRTILNVTSSPVLGGGHSLSNKQDGGIAPFGPGRAHASRSVRQANKKDSKTKGIYGPHSIASLTSVGLQSSLENRLQRLLGKAGSTLYSETWNEKTTPAGRSYLAHTASADPISDNGFTGWATASTADRYHTNERKETDGLLGGQARMVLPSGWPTPQARDWKGPQGRAYQNKRETSSTAGKVTGKKDKQCADLPTAAMLVEDIEKRLPRGKVSGKSGNGFHSVIAKGVQLNPALSRWLMGFPTEWDDCAAMVTRSVSRVPKHS